MEAVMEKKLMRGSSCRLWWPREGSISPDGEGSTDALVVGWLFVAKTSPSAYIIDIVVATTVAREGIASTPGGLDSFQAILLSLNRQLPLRLQEISRLMILGHYRRIIQRNPDVLNVKDGCQRHRTVNDPVDGECYCCASFDLMAPPGCPFVERECWVSLGNVCNKGRQYPVVHHLHIDGHIIKINDVHVILFDRPTYGRCHFSMSSWSFGCDLKASHKMPKWINALQNRTSVPDLDSVVVAINCSTAAKVLVEQHVGVNKSKFHSHATLSHGLIKACWYFMAVFIASVASLLYMGIQLVMRCLRYRSENFLLRILFRHSWKSLHIRSCQFLCWPILLENSNLSCIYVEFAHKDALRKNFIWSNVATDVAMGCIFGVALLSNVDFACLLITTTARYITDNILRTGCVWLMGVPAGFKLNTELAELLGTVSLDAVQVYSTLWFFLGKTFLPYVIAWLALSGIALGLTIPAAICIDTLKLATLHVRTLHRLISFLYSFQIQTLASLWRLFRGRKWNPLRQRLDSYNYSVEQHVVGSLLFSPVLLLLPTTSVFYVFFTMLTVAILLISGLIEIMISVIHATPYAELVLWILRRRRFPSGLWFQRASFPFALNSCHHSVTHGEHETSYLYESTRLQLLNGGSEHSLSMLRSNFATIGQILKPHYARIFDGVIPSFRKSLAYGVLSGQRIPPSLNTNLPTPLPWINIGLTDYWRQCRDSLLSCSGV